MSDTDKFPAYPRDPAAPVIEHAPSQALPPRPAERRRSGAGGTVFTLFLFLLLAGGLYYVWAYPNAQADGDAVGALQRQLQTQEQAAGQHTTQLQALTQQVQTLNDRVDRLEKAQGTPAAGQPEAPAAPAAAPDLGNLPQRVDDLAAKVAALSNQPAPSAPPAADLSDLPQKVDALAAKVAALSNQPAAAPADTGATQQALAALTARVGQIEAADRAAIGQVQTQDKDAIDQAQNSLQAQQKSALGAVDARIGKLEQGAGTVEDTASRAARLERVQAAVVALQAGQKLGDIPGAPPALARFANQPPPTEAALREQFPAAAAHAREVSQPPTARRSFLQRALARLQQSVTVRQGNDVLVGDPAAGVLSDAQQLVDTGDLSGAVRRLDALSGPAAVAMAGWVDQARALVDARAALATLAARG